jgi:hypothetical protein
MDRCLLKLKYGSLYGDLRTYVYAYVRDANGVIFVGVLHDAC